MQIRTIAVTAVALFAVWSYTAGDEPAAEGFLLTEQVTVTASRLPDAPGDADDLPANVTVITHEQIVRSGAADLAELLALQAGSVVYDQTGNGVQTTADLRGFTTGSGTRVFLDGAPLNDAVNNKLALELVPLESLERVEITRGSTAALAGGGSEAGVINLVSRGSQRLSGALGLATGSFGGREYNGRLAHDTGRVDFAISGNQRQTDGFRDNGDGDLTRLSARVGFDLGDERRLQLTLVDADSDFGNPGALTHEELAADAGASPFNMLDFGQERLALASLNYRTPVGRAMTLAANVFVRERETASLTTGRSAPLFGGFALDSDASTHGSTVQLTHRHAVGATLNALTFGGEWLDGDTQARGYSTPFDDPGAIPSTPSSDTISDRTTSSLFVQNSWSPNGAWTLLAGTRHDRDRVALDEALPVSANDASRRFSELSLRGGARWSPGGRHSVYVSYGEGFLPPTSEELFAFPGFGSNPALEPEDSRSYEIGFRGRWAQRVQLDGGLFLIDTDNEIVYDPAAPVGPFGGNVNAGQTRRSGVEASLRAALSSRVDLYTNLTLTEAEFTAGDNDGNEVPLVPGERLATGLRVALPAGITLDADVLYVGRQVLDNDDTNSQAELDRYVVANARVRWRLASVSSPRNGLQLFTEVRNLFDEQYSTRGIYAFDFGVNMDDVFLTPAPGRRYRFGAEWMF